jgi:lysophospholipase L1-like esterase
MIVVLSLIYREGKAQLAAPKSDSLAAFQPPDIYRLDSSYLKEYPLVNFDLNYFQFYTESSPNWELLFDKMEKMCDRTQGKLNFYHIGGSHLQADIYTHDVRVKLQTQQNLLTGERGWVFPFDLAGTNNPWNFEFKSPNNWEKFRCVVPEQADESCGLMGIKVVGHDSISSLKFRYDKTKTKSEIQRIRVYHNKGTFPFTMDWGDKDAQLKSFHIDTIIGYTEVGFAYPFLDFELTFTRDIAGDFPLELYGFELLNDYPGISYSNVGINGASLHSFMACRRFEEQLKVTPPDFFAFSLGTNDGNVLPENFDPQVYKANLEYMMKTVLRTNPDCAILLTVPNDSYFHKTHLNPNIAREREVIRELAVKYKCPVWDLYGIMGGLGSSKKWMNHRLMRSDLVHFTAAGYHLKGDLYFDSFEKARAQFQQRDNKTVKLK